MALHLAGFCHRQLNPLMLLLDTNILIDVLRGEAVALAWLEQQPHISVITWIEVLVGCREGETSRMHDWLESFPRLHVRHRRWRALLASDLLAAGVLVLLAVTVYVPLFFSHVAWFLPLALLPRRLVTERLLR